jgi:hypothetical protein
VSRRVMATLIFLAEDRSVEPRVHVRDRSGAP